MGAAERRQWSSVLRQDLVTSIIDALLTQSFRGVAVTGERGVGKTTLARAVEAGIGTQVHVVYLRGTLAAAPYGQLSFLLARLSEEAMKSPTSIIRGIADMLRRDAAGRPILLILDSLPALDATSVAVVMHLLLTQTAQILVLARSLTDLPEDLYWLVKDQALDHRRLENFSREEVAELLEGVLTGRVSAAAAAVLYASSGGNPLVLHSLVSEQLRCGNLRQRGSVWTLAGELNLGSVVALGDLVRARLERESQSVHEVVEYLALARRLPLAVLVQIADPSVIAEMEESGLISLDETERRWVALRDSYVAEVVRGGLDIGRRKDLHLAVARVVDRANAGMSHEELLDYAAWTLDSGAALAPSVALAASAAAVRLFDPVFALRCAAEIRAGDDQWVAAAEQRAAAYLILSDHQAAVAALEDVSNEQLRNLPVVDYANFVLDRCTGLLWVPGGQLRIPGMLTSARENIWQRARATGSRPSEEDIERAFALIELAGYEKQIHCGEYAAVAGSLEATYRSSHDVGQRLNCGSLLVMAWAVLGRELDAVDLAKKLETEMQRTGASPRMRHWKSEGLFAALLTSGQWRECVTLLTDAMDRHPKTMQYRGGAAELALGLAYTYSGRGDLAIGELLSAAAELDEGATFNNAVLVYSALAFAYAQVGDTTEARHYLDLASKPGPRMAWFSSAMAHFCELMARRWLGEPNAKQKLIELAYEDLAHGRYTTASICLFGATTSGTDEEFVLLEEISSKRQGPMAALNQTIALGSRKREPRTLLTAASMARDLALDAVEARCVVLALDFARDTGDALTARSAQNQLDRLVEALPVLPIAPRTEGPELTERERQVALLARQGQSNREVAKGLDVSVRTVEGHLYQIFAKLGISSRSELDEIFRQ